MSRDWSTAFRAASFRGVPFRVEVEEAQGGRRLAVQPIAASETVVVEDMGRIPWLGQTTAYVTGDAADALAIAFAAALDAPGAGMLVLPMALPRMASVFEWRLARERDRNGHVAFDVAFHEAAGGAIGFAPVGGIGAIDGLFKAAIGTIASAAAGALL